MIWPLVTAALIVSLDQILKSVVRASMELGETIPLIPGVLRLHYLENAGAAFSLFQGMRSLMVAVSLIAFALLMVTLVKNWFPGRALQIVLGAVSGGVAGNLIDRIVRGTVTDFLDPLIWPVFNIADMAISIGAVALIATIVFTKDAGAAGDESRTEDDRGPTIPSR